MLIYFSKAFTTGNCIVSSNGHLPINLIEFMQRFIKFIWHSLPAWKHEPGWSFSHRLSLLKPAPQQNQKRAKRITMFETDSDLLLLHANDVLMRTFHIR